MANNKVETVGSILEALIIEGDLSAHRVSRMIGAGPNSVKKIIDTGGKGLSLEMFRSICAAIGVHPSLVLDKLPSVELLEVHERGRGRPKKERGTEESGPLEKIKMPVRKATIHSTDDTRK